MGSKVFNGKYVSQRAQALDHYQAWQRERNPARAALEARYGYDTKHAMHLLRLLRMGMEILETGEVHVYRPDREWPLAVRNGLLQYEELLALAAEYEARLATLQAASTLPEAPDVARVEELVVALQGEWLGARGELYKRVSKD